MVLSIIEWVQTYIYQRVVVHHHLYSYSPCSSLINDWCLLCRLFSLPSTPSLCHLFLHMITYASYTKEWFMLKKHSYIACIPPPTKVSNPEPHASSWSLNPPKSSVIHFCRQDGTGTLLTDTWSGHVVRSTDAVRPRACVYDWTKGNTIRITNPTLFFAKKLANYPFSTGRFCTCSNLDKQRVSVSGLFRVKNRVVTLAMAIPYSTSSWWERDDCLNDLSSLLGSISNRKDSTWIYHKIGTDQVCRRLGKHTCATASFM